MYDYVIRVGQSMADMMSNYGDPHVVDAGWQSIDLGSDGNGQAPYFVELLYRFIEDGALRFVHEAEAHKVKTPKVVLISGGDTPPSVFVAREVLDRLLAKRSITLPDHGKVTSALRIGNALDRECEYNGEVGWMIVESWWSRQIERCRASHRLQVIGGGR
jgi:hypothetical protein